MSGLKILNRRFKKENFMIKFNKNFTSDAPPPISCKRVIFVSLRGLFQTYHKCPPYILHSALVVMSLKKRWIYSPSKFMDEIQTVSGGVIKYDSTSQQFFELIQWKDSQGLVIWANDEDDEDDASPSDNMFHPFWQYVSQKLVTLHDPVTSAKYEALPDPANDITFWKEQIKSIQTTSKGYCCYTLDAIMGELYFKLLNFECMKIIFNASNPGSFDVVKRYNQKQITFDRSEPVDDDDGEWWLSSDYFD